MVTSPQMMPASLATRNPEYAVLEILVHGLYHIIRNMEFFQSLSTSKFVN